MVQSKNTITYAREETGTGLPYKVTNLTEAIGQDGEPGEDEKGRIASIKMKMRCRNLERVYRSVVQSMDHPKTMLRDFFADRTEGMP